MEHGKPIHATTELSRNGVGRERRVVRLGRGAEVVTVRTARSTAGLPERAS